MSIKRIESAYATYMDDERISSTQMAVLQALAYCENGKSKNEDCFPGKGYLEKLTHFSNTGIDNACKQLREMGVISWTRHINKRGEWDSNSYKFLFPHKKIEKRRVRYESVSDTIDSTMATTLPTLGNRVAYPPQPDCLPSPTTLPTLGNEVAPNTERNTESIPLLNSDSEAGRGVGEPKPMFSVSGVLKKADYRSDLQRERDELITDAINACRLDPKDKDERAAFGSVIRQLETSVVLDVIDQLRSELAQGGHKKAKNLAAILMTKLKLRIPMTYQVQRNNIESLIKNRYS